MKPSEIRLELLQQHDQIRVIMEVTKTIAESISAGRPRRGDLSGCVLRLADAVRAHNCREEALLLDFIPSVDAWGGAREAIMRKEHIQEHARLDVALRGIPLASPDLAAFGVVALIRLMREHMDREEAAFLGEDVLRDDVVVANQTDG